MAIRDILRMGDTRLMQRAEEVASFNTPELHQLLTDMQETMLAHEGIGLAAPQIGIPLRVVIFGMEHSTRYPDAPAIPYTVLINPLLISLGDETSEAWEGCLSLPDLRGKVTRPEHVRYRGHDACGQLIDRTVSGFHARVVQHECDHLDGVLYPMRMEDMSFFGFSEALFPESSQAR